MPYTVSLVNQHMVHLNRQPHIHGIMPLAVIYVHVYGERICLDVLILYKVCSGLTHCAEITLCIVVTVIEYTPLLDCGLKYKRICAVSIHAPYPGLWCNLVVAVQLNYGNLLLGGSITYL